jgi:alkanesulfonate monooxygenase SsuD/methylene tetrahydromethanopterin reductase-like flavin-dependent oxidoreductase (luciferase family)
MIGLQFGLRNPPHLGRPVEAFYAAMLEQMRFADAAGFESIWMSEHHFKEDGDLPSPLVVAGAAAACTTRIRIGTNIVLLPLHHPLRLAEEAALVAILSNGRFVLGVGAGYVDIEFAAFGEDLAARPSAMEDGIAIMRKAWSGQRFHFEGERWSVPEVKVTPVPEGGKVPLYMGAIAPAAIRRAGRLADGFICGYPRDIPAYLHAVELAGRSPEDAKVVVNMWAVIAEDPERAWAHIGPHAVRQLNHYVETGGWGDEPPFRDPADVLTRGAYSLWDAETAVREITALRSKYPQVTDQLLQSCVPGESVDSSNERLEFIASKVLPSVGAAPLPQGAP